MQNLNATMLSSTQVVNGALVDKGKMNKVHEVYFVLFSIAIFFYFLLGWQLTFQESFIVAYQLFLVLRFINNFGYTICFYDYLVFYSAMDTLVFPIIGYRYFNAENHLARVWGWYMRVPEDVYFGYLIPANLMLFAGVSFLSRKFTAIRVKDLYYKLTENAKDKGKAGIVLTVIGFVFTFLENSGGSLSFVFTLLSMLKYVGPLYIYFSDLPFKNKALYGSMGLFLIQSIAKGLFGEFVMYLILALIVVTIKYNLRFITKVMVFVIGLILITILQSIKSTYRSITWQGNTIRGISLQNSSKFEVFGTLFLDRLTSSANLFDERTSFGLYMRMNQGFLISRAMDYVPRVEPYAEGETIWRSIAAIIVPRFLWPDKPVAGGHENLVRFLGIKQQLNYSMNIGPYGEAYGNFGVQYGIVFIFGFALFLSFLLKKYLDNCEKRPTLLLWGPLLFYYTLTVETDILTTVNSFVKGAVFVAIVFWISKKYFKTSL